MPSDEFTRSHIANGQVAPVGGTPQRDARLGSCRRSRCVISLAVVPNVGPHALPTKRKYCLEEIS